LAFCMAELLVFYAKFLAIAPSVALRHLPRFAGESGTRLIGFQQLSFVGKTSQALVATLSREAGEMSAKLTEGGSKPKKKN